MSDLNIKATEKDLAKAGVLMGASLLADEEEEIISVSPNVDLQLGGGIPEGSWVSFSGNEKCGKSTLALHICAKAQQQNRPTFYVDVEHRLKKMHLKGVKDLKLSDKQGDTSGLQVIRSNREKILAAEEILTGAVNIVKSHPRCVLVLDSTSALCNAKEMGSDITGTGRAAGPRMLAEFCRQLGPVVPVNDVIIISIQHLIANTSGYGAKYMEDSGRKLQYQGDTKLRCKKVTPWLEGDRQIGQSMEWQVVFSALGPPGGNITSWLRYGMGIDEAYELIDIGLDLGLIDKAGAWFTLTSLLDSQHETVLDFVGDKDPEKVLRAQGRANLYQILDENKIFQEIIYSKVKELL